MAMNDAPSRLRSQTDLSPLQQIIAQGSDNIASQVRAGQGQIQSAVDAGSTLGLRGAQTENINAATYRQELANAKAKALYDEDVNLDHLKLMGDTSEVEGGLGGRYGLGAATVDARTSQSDAVSGLSVLQLEQYNSLLAQGVPAKEALLQASKAAEANRLVPLQGKKDAAELAAAQKTFEEASKSTGNIGRSIRAAADANTDLNYRMSDAYKSPQLNKASANGLFPATYQNLALTKGSAGASGGDGGSGSGAALKPKGTSAQGDAFYKELGDTLFTNKNKPNLATLSDTSGWYDYPTKSARLEALMPKGTAAATKAGDSTWFTQADATGLYARTVNAEREYREDAAQDGLSALSGTGLRISPQAAEASLGDLAKAFPPLVSTDKEGNLVRNPMALPPSEIPGVMTQVGKVVASEITTPGSPPVPNTSARRALTDGLIVQSEQRLGRPMSNDEKALFYGHTVLPLLNGIAELSTTSSAAAQSRIKEGLDTRKAGMEYRLRELGAE